MYAPPAGKWGRLCICGSIGIREKGYIMILYTCENMGLSFGGETILEQINITINEKDRIGIIGDNGASYRYTADSPTTLQANSINTITAICQ